MKFSVIYDWDMPHGDDVSRGYPPGFEANADIPGGECGPWKVTEHSDDSDERGDLGGDWEHGIHRKLCAILTKEEFRAFVEKCVLQASRTETAGSIGAPGFDFGWAPAIAFDMPYRDRYDKYLACAYVTPLPCRRDGEPIRKGGADERDWKRLRAAILREFE